MDNPEEILHSLEEFTKVKPKDIPRELEEYLSFVAKTGDPVYQWNSIKSLLREKLINVTAELYESCPSIEIPPSPNVEVFNYEKMKSFILEKLDTFAAAPFTVQRICELLTNPRKEYNRIDKYMRALEKNILVVSTTEPGNRRAENGEGIVNGIESDHYQDNQTINEINVEDIEMEETPWSKMSQSMNDINYQDKEVKIPHIESVQSLMEEEDSGLDEKIAEVACPEISIEENKPFDHHQLFVTVEPLKSDDNIQENNFDDNSTIVSAVPAAVQRRRDSIEPEEHSDEIPSSTQKQKLLENENLVNTKQTTSSLLQDQQYSENETEISVTSVENVDSNESLSDEVNLKVDDSTKNSDEAQTANLSITTSIVDQLSFTINTDEDLNLMKSLSQKNTMKEEFPDSNSFKNDTASELRFDMSEKFEEIEGDSKIVDLIEKNEEHNLGNLMNKEGTDALELQNENVIESTLQFSGELEESENGHIKEAVKIDSSEGNNCDLESSDTVKNSEEIRSTEESELPKQKTTLIT